MSFAYCSFHLFLFSLFRIHKAFLALPVPSLPFLLILIQEDLVSSRYLE